MTDSSDIHYGGTKVYPSCCRFHASGGVKAEDCSTTKRQRSPLFEIVDSSGDTTHGLSAEEAGQWITDALSLPHDKRPPLLVVKHCSVYHGGA